MRKVRVGVVGLGHNGVAHVEAHRRVGKSQVVAACDLNEQRLLETGSKRLGISRLYTSAQELCADPQVEAVSINTGDPFHLEPFLAAIGHGKHVLLEKPVANSTEQVEQIARAARGADPALKLAVGYVLRFNPLYEAIKAECDRGALGRIYYMEGDYVHNLLYQARQTDTRTGRNWYLEEEIPIVGGGSHPLDLLRWFCGRQVVQVSAYSNHVAFPAMASDDCQVALFRFEDGTIAKVAALYAPRCAMAPHYNLRVYGTMGTVERDTVALAADEDDVHPAFAPVRGERLGGHPFDAEVEDWIDSIVQDRRPRCDIFDGINSTAATLKAAESARLGSPLPVPVYGRP